MKIRKLRIDIQPHYFGGSVQEFRMDVYTDRNNYSTTQNFLVSDFECCFERLMETAKREILKLTKDDPKV